MTNHVLILLIPLCVVAPMSEATAAEASRPNIVVVMADDIGLGDLGFYHRQRTGEEPVVSTPSIDQLIEEGMRFSDAHSPASLCAPTRFSMMTGNYSYRNMRPWGVWTPEADALIEPDFTTVARIAKAGGYSTAFFGKWGLGGVWTQAKVDYSKMDAGASYYGFDYAVELPQGIQNKPYAFYENQQWMKLKPDSVLTQIPVEQTGYAAEKANRDRSGVGDSNWDPALAGPVLVGKAVAYIENQTAACPDGAFFMYYCSQAVHVPHRPPTELDGVKIGGTAPGHHGDMILELDTQVGMIVKALKQTGRYDNTLFIFSSDNGGLNADVEMKKDGHDSSNGLSGKKGSIYEGGHRVPFIAVWPGKIQPGSESHEPIVGHDIVATIAALANQPIDRNVVKDSISLLPFFTRQLAGQRHQYLVHQQKGQKMPHYALRDGEWKLIITGKSTEKLEGLAPLALYNLKEDLSEDETTNLIENPESSVRVRAMLATYQRLRETGELTVTDK